MVQTGLVTKPNEPVLITIDFHVAELINMALSRPTKIAFGPYTTFEYVVDVFSNHFVLPCFPCDKGINEL
jgi:hypothetical protein